MIRDQSIARPALREDVVAILRDRLAGGEIPPGARLSDQAIAEELDISRTPVREALASLAGERLVEAVPNRGFRAPRLRRDEPREVYPLIWTLEIFGLREVLETSTPRIAALRAVNERLARATSLRRKLALDDEWHDLLLEKCRNGRLRSILSGLKLQVRRYEAEFLREGGRRDVSMDDHERIAAALERGDHGRAVEVLRENWSFTLRTILAWLPGEEDE